MTEKSVPERLHWYAFSFRGQEGHRDAVANCYSGYPDQRITLARVREQQHVCGLETRNQRPVLIATCYLGFMTRAEFLEGTGEE